MAWYFACESDHHYGLDYGQFSCLKPNSLDELKQIHAQTPLDFVLCPGDITHRGNDGSRFRFLCGYYDSANDEFQRFVEDYIVPLETIGIPVYICAGNHDVDKKTYPNMSILKYMRNNYDATYSWWHETTAGCYIKPWKGILFICAGMYAVNLDWLRQVLANTPKITPIVLFQHYDLEEQMEGEVWTNADREAFYEIIKNHNVKLIIHGHRHDNATRVWHGIQCVSCFQPMVVRVNSVINEIEVLLHPLIHV
jgi:3',5'-cyclic AMP phosphodiesterase CpdA